MSRPRLPIGTFGEIGYSAAMGGRVTARARYRDWDGKIRLVQATAGTARGADRALKTKLGGRTDVQPSTSSLTADSSFADLVEYWLADLDLENRLSKGTRQLYERKIRQLVLPAFADLA